MIYLDTSVVLAQLLDRDRIPPPALWEEVLVSSRLLQYESWVVLNARGLATSHGEDLRALLGRIGMLELDPAILARAVEPFPAPLRTLDALHLASLTYLREAGPAPTLATYDQRMAKVARKMKVEVQVL